MKAADERRKPHPSPAAVDAATPEGRLATFVEEARASRLHGRGSPFEAQRWDVGAQVRQRPGVPARPGELKVSFAAADRGPAEFGAFVRAYLGTLPRSGHATLRTNAQAAGLLAQAMDAEGVASVAGIEVATLNRACALALAGHSPATAARLAGAVLALGECLHDGGMTRLPLVGALRPSVLEAGPDLDRAGRAFAERSARLLPSPAFLDLLARAHGLARTPADVVATRVPALLLSAAARINEVLALDEESEAERDGFLGLRWRGSKGARDGVKWVVPSMAATVRSALADLRRVTDEGRAIKRWYDARPRALHLPPALEYLRCKAALDGKETALLLGPLRMGVDPSAPRARAEAAGTVSFAEVEACLLAQLTGRMRDAGGPASHPLLVVPLGTFGGASVKPSPCMFETVRRGHVTRALAGPLFRRLGLDDKEASGRTHPFRHLLVTEALRGGLSMAEVAEWCGHASPCEVRSYDHRSAAEMRAVVGRAWSGGRRTGSPLSPGRQLGG